MTRWGNVRLLSAAMGAVLVLGTVACGSPARQSSTPSEPAASNPVARSAAPAAPQTAADGAKNEAGASSAADSRVDAATSAMQSAQAFDRMVIRTAQVALEVADMEASLAQVRTIAQQGGGFVSASNTRVERVNDQERTVADLTLQVRSETADAALAALRGLGKVTSETSGSQDVTEEYVDLDSSLRNLQASEAAILKLMERASRIEDVLALQRELTTVRGQIERIQGRKRYLERRTDMATITLAMRLPPVEGARPLSGAWDPLGVAQRAWQASLTVLRVTADVLIMVVAFSWWLVPLVAGAVYLWLHRRRPTAPRAPTPADA